VLKYKIIKKITKKLKNQKIKRKKEKTCKLNQYFKNSLGGGQTGCLQ